MNKIVLMAPTPPIVGGICRWVETYLNNFDVEGWKIITVDTKDVNLGSVYEPNRKKRPINQIKRCLRIWNDLTNCLKDSEVRIVHANIPDTTLSYLREIVSLLITKSKGKKFIVQFHCTIQDYPEKKVRNTICRFLCKKADGIITLNSDSAKYVEKYSGVTATIVPNFISEDFIRNDKRIINSLVKNILFVGGINKAKGCYEIISSASKLLDIKFNFVGYVNKEFQNVKKTENVLFWGEKNRIELINIYDSMDLFLFPSYTEGFCLALLEAMSRGLPCIASNVGANRDMLEEGGGIVLDEISDSEIWKAIQKLSVPDARIKCSMWNIEKVKNHYTAEKVIKLFINIYEKILGGEV